MPRTGTIMKLLRCILYMVLAILGTGLGLILIGLVAMGQGPMVEHPLLAVAALALLVLTAPFLFILLPGRQLFGKHPAVIIVTGVVFVIVAIFLAIALHLLFSFAPSSRLP